MRERGPQAFRPPRILRGRPSDRGSAHAADWKRRARPLRRETDEGERGGASEPERALQRCRPDPKAPGAGLPVGCGSAQDSLASRRHGEAPRGRRGDCAPGRTVAPASSTPGG
ncbi:hypothetical protein NDU88_006510 [Pleurodeles waltl]|uniref:Uncharacterized protein n=1 Tax=Pleurodeles waltl TaxID=8319 RepID=A0AAV7WGK8_PLEWA|nr:hypothetical protein NDU88_006510 [Pleurodeles waltl]